jgi:CAAX prenyl protease-like protein
MGDRLDASTPISSDGPSQQAGQGTRQEPGHGWWPYALPYLAFLGTVEVFRRVPDDWVPLGLLVKPAVPAALMLYYAAHGAYPELRGIRLELSRRGLDVAVGIALAGLWMAPYLWIEAIRPADAQPFDPHQLGASAVGLTIALRMIGYALVTPFFEEVFIRSFVMRYADVFQRGGDFRNVPLARYSRVGFLASVVVFTLGHVPWEYWVAIPWVVLTNLWFYYRKDLYAVIVVHAATNAAILVAAAVAGDAWVNGRGGPLSLWLFV